MADIQRPPWPTAAVLMIFLVILGGFIPAIFAATTGTESETIDMDQGETVKLKAPLEATLIDASQNQIEVSVFDTDTAEAANTTQLNQGESEDLILRGNTITVTYTEDIGNNAAIVSFEYPVFYEWDNTTIAFVNSIAVIILGLLLYMIYFIFFEGVETI